MIPDIDRQITYSLENPGDHSSRTLLCYAALDMGLGHLIRDQKQDASWFCGAAQMAVAKVMPRSGTCGLLDTTTVLNAFRLLDPSFPVPLLPAGAIFDLATFITACLFDDNLLFFENEEISPSDFSRLLDGVPISTLPWGKGDDFSLIVENAWGEAERNTPDLFGSPHWADRFIGHWTKVLGKDLDHEALTWTGEYRKYFSSVDSVAVKQAIINSDPHYAAMAAGLAEEGEFVAETSVRSVFYSVIANAVGATYHASAFRTRLRDFAYERAATSAVTDTFRLVSFLDRSFRGDISTDSLVCPDVPMPFALSAALVGVSNCSQLCERIVELREVAAPLRSKRSELAKAIGHRDQAAVNALFRATTDRARALADSDFAAGGTLASQIVLSTGGTRPILGALGRLLLSVSKLPEDVQGVLRQRLVRPELWAVTRLSAQARKVLECLDPLSQILRPKGVLIPNEFVCVDVLRRLAA